MIFWALISSIKNFDPIFDLIYGILNNAKEFTFDGITFENISDAFEILSDHARSSEDPTSENLLDAYLGYLLLFMSKHRLSASQVCAMANLSN